MESVLCFALGLVFGMVIGFIRKPDDSTQMYINAQEDIMNKMRKALIESKYTLSSVRLFLSSPPPESIKHSVSNSLKDACDNAINLIQNINK